MTPIEQMEAIKQVLRLAVHIVDCRNGDVDMEDGSFTTTGITEMICLESALCEAFPTGSDDVDPKLMLPQIEAITDLQSMQGEAVGYVGQICGRTAMVDIHNGKTLEPGADIYTQPQSPAVDGCVLVKSDVISDAVRDLKEVQMRLIQCGTYDNPQLTVRICLDRTLEAMLSASQQGDSNE